MTAPPPSRWARAFLPLWLGQSASLLASGVTSFAIAVWLYQRTGSATQVAMVALCALLPGLLVAPLAGALIDRRDLRRMLLASDAGAAVTALIVAALAWRGELTVVPLCVAVAAGSLLGSLRQPAYHALVARLVPASALGRASGLLQLGNAATELIGPMIGGIAVVTVGLPGVVGLDLASFVIAIGGLMLAGRAALAAPAAVDAPAADAVPVAAPRPGLRSLIADIAAAWRYLRGQPGALALLGFHAAWNFSVGLVTILATPFLLSFAGPRAAGITLTAGGVGMVAATALMSAWGGPRRPIRLVIIANLVVGVALSVAAVRASLPLFLGAAFVAYFGVQVAATATQTYWLRTVAPAMRGRVFALRRVIPLSTLPLAYAVAGPLADHVFEPLLAPGGALAATVGEVFGVGKGRGIGLLFTLNGLLFLATTIAAGADRRLRGLDPPPTAAADVPAADPGSA